MNYAFLRHPLLFILRPIQHRCPQSEAAVIHFLVTNKYYALSMGKYITVNKRQTLLLLLFLQSPIYIFPVKHPFYIVYHTDFAIFEEVANILPKKLFMRNTKNHGIKLPFQVFHCTTE